MHYMKIIQEIHVWYERSVNLHERRGFVVSKYCKKFVDII